MKAHHYTEPEDILRDADIAMYQAKAKGKARYEFFDSAMHESVVQRLQMEADLRLAVEHGEQLVLHYQPIVDLKTHSLVGFEALARWIHPKHGMLPPGEFIPLAEETGIIHHLGDCILRRACRQLRQWRKEFDLPPHFRISINLSSKSFLQQNFIERLTNIFEETGVTSDGIAIEITESMIMENIDIALVTMQKLKEMGIHIHIDDFGTGYSSLSYLHHFPVNALKIDRSFIRKMSHSNDDREIVKTIISLAQNLSLDVIAEGIEDTHELLAIKNMQCQYAQGYLFSEPMTPADAEVWIQRKKFVTI
jgi:EAL domain-containing protein (putative c-di-GMP-specific phosphodiesterase class I)